MESACRTGGRVPPHHACGRIRPVIHRQDTLRGTFDEDAETTTGRARAIRPAGRRDHGLRPARPRGAGCSQPPGLGRPTVGT